MNRCGLPFVICSHEGADVLGSIVRQLGPLGLAFVIAGAAATCDPPALDERDRPPPRVVVTGPDMESPRVVGSRYVWEIAVRGLLNVEQRGGLPDTHWAVELGPRYVLLFEGRGVRIREFFYPYARVGFDASVGFGAPFIHVPAGQRRSDGSPFPDGWLRVPGRFAHVLGFEDVPSGG